MKVCFLVGLYPAYPVWEAVWSETQVGLGLFVLPWKFNIGELGDSVGLGLREGGGAGDPTVLAPIPFFTWHLFIGRIV